MALHPGQTLEEALAALQAATGKVVVAEPALTEARLPKETRAGTLNQALDQITHAFDLVAVVRSQHISLQRGYFGADQDLTLTLDQLQERGQALVDLARPFAADMPSQVAAAGQKGRKPGPRRFWESLTTLQREQLKTNQGLSYTKLNAEQKACWSAATNWVFVGSTAQSALHVGAFLDHWGELKLNLVRSPRDQQLTLSGPGDRTYAGLGRLLGLGSLLKGAQDLPTQLPRTAITEPLVYPMKPFVPQLPGLFRKPIAAFAGRTTVKELNQTISEYAPVHLRTPAADTNRPLLVYSRNAQAVDVLEAVLDLFNWRLEQERPGHYYLGLPRYRPSREVGDLYAHTQELLSPEFRYLWAGPGSKYTLPRTRRRFQRLQEAFLKAAAGKSTVAVRELPRSAQTELAALLFYVGLQGDYRPLMNSRGAPVYLAQPERCVYHLEGDRVTFSGLNDLGRTSSWFIQIPGLTGNNGGSVFSLHSGAPRPGGFGSRNIPPGFLQRKP